MQVTEVRVKLTGPSQDRLRGFCSITLDGCFVVRDIKIIDGPNGAFVAMPSRKAMDHCPQCRTKNHLRARFCNQCGAQLNDSRAGSPDQSRLKLHCDVAHPINPDSRHTIQDAILKAYHEELDRSKQPGYVSANVDDFDAA